MSPLVETFSEVIEEEVTDELSPSEDVYFEFRRVLESGFFDSNFDIIPAKSAANRNRHTGEPFTDQSLRNHITNGAAFGSRFNRALSKLDDSVALSPNELRVALALYAVHDAHKTSKAQKRREEQWGEKKRADADKDISDEELRELLDTLNLTSFVGIEGEEHDAEGEIKFNAYLASALAAEKSSGRHHSVYSKSWAQKYRSWVRLMDAAAGLSSPQEVDTLQNRANNISEQVNLHYHHLQDTKGIVSNILTKSLAERAKKAGLEPIVFFEDGAVYASDSVSNSGITLLFEDEQAIEDEFYTEFIETLVESNPTLGDIKGVQNSLNTTNWRMGYINITETSFLFADSTAKTSTTYSTPVEVVIDAVRTEITDRAQRDSNRYSIYESALKRAIEVGLLENLPPSYQKPQLLGAFIGTIFRNLLYHETGLCGKGSDGYEQAVIDVGTILDVPEAATLYLEAEGTGSWNEATITNLADAIDESQDALEEELKEGISPHKQNRVESVFLGLAYLYRDGDYDERSLSAILSEVQDRFMTQFEAWPEHWGENLSYWESDRQVSEKQKDFADRRTGNFSEAFPRYVSRYLVVDGGQFSRELDDPTFDEYVNPKYGSSQPRMCLLCRDELLGDSTSFDDYETNQDEVGRSLTFTHLRELAPSSGETNSIICPICQFELNLRNAVHSTDTENDSLYVFLAPDYFHSPVDLAIANRINSLLHSSVGSFIDSAQNIITSDVSSRSEAAELFLDVFREDESEDFQRSIQNYDSSYADASMIGVFRIDRPTKSGTSEAVNRTTFWTTAVYIAHVLAWGTGNRVLLSNSPFPSLSFDEFDEMVCVEGLPAPVERHLPARTTISNRNDLGQIPSEIAVTQSQSAQRQDESSDSTYPEEDGRAETTQQPNRSDSGDDEESLRATSPTQETIDSFVSGEVEGETETQSASENNTTSNREILSLQSEFSVTLYRLSALLYLTKLSYGYDVQRVTSLLSSLTEPFAGANSILKGQETNETYSAQFGARVLDATTHPTMSNSLQTLADHGFQVLSPESPQQASTYDYERLFRVACDTLSDGFAERANRELLIQTVAGEVAKTGSRINQNRRNAYDPSEGHLSDDARAFAEVFVDDIFYDVCEGDYYNLRRLQNRLASGFNLAMRESQMQFFELLNDTDEETAESDDKQVATESTTE